jgi:menaquinone-dependent protoporphyrinogen oxidase
MRVLVTWGSKRGGTEGIARIIAYELNALGVEAALTPASNARDLRGYDAAIIGGALYMNRWHRDARRLVARHIAGLRRIPVWLFSSGPLDASAQLRRDVTAVRAHLPGDVGHRPGDVDDAGAALRSRNCPQRGRFARTWLRCHRLGGASQPLLTYPTGK